MSCGNSGYPSDDRRTRRYTEAQCRSMDGIPFPNGYCHYIKEGVGGSFSTDCAYLNDDMFDWFNRQPLWVQIGGTVGVLGAGYFAVRQIKSRR